MPCNKFTYSNSPILKQIIITVNLVQRLDKLIVQVQYKVHQQMNRWSGNLERIRESEKVSFKMVTKNNYAI